MKGLQRLGLLTIVMLVLLMVVGGAAAQTELPVLRVGLLPVLDTLPVFIAQEQGYFEEAGITVEVIPVASPVQRDELMQAGEIDGMLNEMASTALFNREGVQVQTVAVARIPFENAPAFRILAAPNSGFTSVQDLAGVGIGVSLNTIIEYTTTRVLEAEGLATDQIVFESVPAIPERFQLLMSGDLQAATLPDPLASAAIAAGAILIADDANYAQYSISTLTFSVAAIETMPDAVAGFVTAYTRAVEALNADPEAFRETLLTNVQVPEPLQQVYQIPPFPVAQIPAEDEWADVNAWLIGKELLEAPLAYEESINPAFVPEVEMEMTPEATEAGS